MRLTTYELLTLVEHLSRRSAIYTCSIGRPDTPCRLLLDNAVIAIVRSRSRWRWKHLITTGPHGALWGG